MTYSDVPAEPASFAPSGPETAPHEQPDALELLRRDHQAVARLLNEYDRAGDAVDKVAVAERLCLALAVHARIEEELFYPTLRQAGVSGERVDNAVVEHMTARQLIADVETASVDDPLLDAKVRVLGVYSLRHAAEEEAELFEAARERGIDLRTLGARMAARKAELCREAAVNLKTRLRAAGGPSVQLDAFDAPPSHSERAATNSPLRAAGAAADLALTVLPGGSRLRRLLRPGRGDHGRHQGHVHEHGRSF